MKNAKKYYKIGLHIHTTLSDGHKTPEEAAEEYKNDGFDALALTDHWVYGKTGNINGLHIISGCEYNLGAADTISGVMHILGLGMKDDPKIDRNATRMEVVDGIRRAGGMAVLAHPAWSLNTPEDLFSLPGIEATEIFNAVSDAHMSLRPYSDHFIDLCANAGHFPKILATDDAHYYDGSDSRRGWICAELDELTDDGILDAIRRGAFYASEGPELYVKREGNRFIIDTSPCSVIGTLSNLSWAKDRVLRGEGITHFEYEAKENEKWLRIEVADANGKKAWSNTYSLK